MFSFVVFVFMMKSPCHDHSHRRGNTIINEEQTSSFRISVLKHIILFDVALQQDCIHTVLSPSFELNVQNHPANFKLKNDYQVHQRMHFTVN